MLEDRLLVWKIKHGNRDALRQVYEKYKDDIFTIAASMVNERARPRISFTMSLSLLPGPLNILSFYESLKSYLITCAVNKITDRFRKKMYQIVELERISQIDSDSESPETPDRCQ